MPYYPNENPPRRWFAARTFMVQPKACLDKHAEPGANPDPNQLRLTYINILRALRTLYRLSPDNHVENLLDELEPLLKPHYNSATRARGVPMTSSWVEQLQRLNAQLWENPDPKILKGLYDIVIDSVFFAVYLEEREYELFYDYYEYIPTIFEDDVDGLYGVLVEAGLAGSVKDAAARYGANTGEIVNEVIGNKAFRIVMREGRINELRDIHRDEYWKYDELNSIGRDFPTTHKGKNFIP